MDARHPDDEALLDYWLGDAADADLQRIDEHLMGCDACGARVDALIALARGVREACDAGAVGAFVTPAFADALARSGRRVREYRFAAGASVNCSVAPDDEALVARFAVPLAGVTRLDAVTTDSLDGVARRSDDVPFDPSSDQVVWLAPLADVRAMPAHRIELRLIARDGDGERTVGRYVLDHRPWPG